VFILGKGKEDENYGESIARDNELTVLLSFSNVSLSCEIELLDLDKMATS
jgi:hypothetical protein